MKEFSKGFYQSKSWKECRKNYLLSVHNLCERCKGIAKIVHHKKYITPYNIHDPYITLNHDNLEALCQDCHNKAHHRKGDSASKRYTFDLEGNVVHSP